MWKAASVLFALAAPLLAATNWVDDGNEAFYNLDYDRSLASYEKALAVSPESPNDAVLHNHVAHALLYREMFRDGALESELVSGNNSFIRRLKLEPAPEVEKRFFSEIDRAIELSQACIAKNPRDTAALHALSVSYALRANYGFLVRKSWRASLYDSSQARKYDSQVTELEPDNYDARLLQGGYDYIVGSLSWSLRALGSIAGFHGDKQRGLHTIEEVAAKGKENRVDAEIVLCALYRREGQPLRAIPLVTKLIDRYPRNYLLRFELAQMYGATGNRALALNTLRDIAKLKQENAPGYDRIPWEKVYYETGNLQFWFDDFDHAMANLKKVTASEAQLRELDLNTGVLALMRQGQIYDLENHHKLAVQAYREAVRFAPQADAAKESQHYINSPYTRRLQQRQERG
ncbi:MAG TPA: tetratricopeptide repeat protein [Bryobacteraceae bacterium]|jgi:tetratricopeptide (TPR) repeat protein|nr:tetratricopeptide repeat protein [Bryobacteraceae bacterium]